MEEEGKGPELNPQTTEFVGEIARLVIVNNENDWVGSRRALDEIKQSRRTAPELEARVQKYEATRQAVTDLPKTAARALHEGHEIDVPQEVVEQSIWYDIDKVGSNNLNTKEIGSDGRKAVARHVPGGDFL